MRLWCEEIEVEECSRGARIANRNLGALHEQECSFTTGANALQERPRGEHGKRRHPRLRRERIRNVLARPLAPECFERAESVRTRSLGGCHRQQPVDGRPELIGTVRPGLDRFDHNPNMYSTGAATSTPSLGRSPDVLDTSADLRKSEGVVFSIGATAS
jgi:hypothetical protein